MCKREKKKSAISFRQSRNEVTDFFGYTPQSPWIHSTVTMDTLHSHHGYSLSFHGYTPQSPWIHSIVTKDTFHSHHGHTPQLPRIHSTESYPVYLSELLTVYRPSRQPRSISDTITFRIPFTKTKTFGQRAFSFTGPTEWNSLPYDVRHSASTSFKQALKTHLFKSAYN